jgi:hypothetical protein
LRPIFEHQLHRVRGQLAPSVVTISLSLAEWPWSAGQATLKVSITEHARRWCMSLGRSQWVLSISGHDQPDRMVPVKNNREKLRQISAEHGAFDDVSPIYMPWRDV